VLLFLLTAVWSRQGYSGTIFVTAVLWNDAIERTGDNGTSAQAQAQAQAQAGLRSS